MPVWKNSKLTVYHGTDDISIGAVSTAGTAFSLGTILSGFKINLKVCRPLTDFGQGFYVTTNLHQAKEWANARVLRVMSPLASHRAIVIGFEIDRDWLSSLESLAFVRAQTPGGDFWDLVADCRTGYPPHQRLFPRTAYDVVYGPVSLWTSRLLINDCDQISFHTPVAIRGLINPWIEAIAPARRQTFP